METVEFVGSTVRVGFSTDNLYELDFLLLRLYANHKTQLSQEERRAVMQMTSILRKIRQETHQQTKTENTKAAPPPLPLRTRVIAKELQHDDDALNLCTGWYRK